jgi:hypothetical protein
MTIWQVYQHLLGRFATEHGDDLNLPAQAAGGPHV